MGEHSISNLGYHFLIGSCTFFAFSMICLWHFHDVSPFTSGCKLPKRRRSFPKDGDGSGPSVQAVGNVVFFSSDDTLVDVWMYAVIIILRIFEVYTYIHTCMHACMHTYRQTDRHTHTHTHIHTDTQTHRHTDTQTHRHTDTQTHRHRHTETQTHRHTYTHTHIHTYTYTHTHTHITLHYTTLHYITLHYIHYRAILVLLCRKCFLKVAKW